MADDRNSSPGFNYRDNEGGIYCLDETGLLIEESRLSRAQLDAINAEIRWRDAAKETSDDR